MKKILTFKLFEAGYTDHFNKRFKERIENLYEISLDILDFDEIESKIEESIGPEWKNLLIDSIIRDTERRILKRVKFVTYPRNYNVAVPISFLSLEFNGKKYPIEITSYSTDKKKPGGVSVYKGSQIWVSISADMAWTIKVFGKNKTPDAISSNLKAGVSGRYGNLPFRAEPIEEDFKTDFSWNPETGSFETGEEEKRGEMSIRKTVPERKTISPGDEIGLIINKISPDSFTYGKIGEITNMGEIKDKQKTGSLSEVEGIKLSFLPSRKEDRIVSNGREIPFVSTLKSGSRISIDGIGYVVLGSQGGKPLVASEPSIIKSGKVQTWVEEAPL